LLINCFIIICLYNIIINLIGSTCWINIMGQKFLIKICWFYISFTISMESRFAKICSKRRVS
jgi:hypothetical protein